MASKRPWLKWYPRDWAADACLRSCSLAARGLWIEMLGLAHRGDPYGHVTINGHAPDNTQIAAVVGSTSKVVTAALAELEAVGVFSRTESGVVYSRRMVRDGRRSADGLEAIQRRPDRQPTRDPSRSPTSIPSTQKPEARSQSPPLPPLPGVSDQDKDKPFASEAVDLARWFIANVEATFGQLPRASGPELVAEARQLLQAGVGIESLKEIIADKMSRSAREGRPAPWGLRGMENAIRHAIASLRAAERPLRPFELDDDPDAAGGHGRAVGRRDQLDDDQPPPAPLTPWIAVATAAACSSNERIREIGKDLERAGLAKRTSETDALVEKLRGLIPSLRN